MEPHRFKLGRKHWTVREHLPARPFLSVEQDVMSLFAILKESVVETDAFTKLMTNQNVYISFEQLSSVVDWLIELTCERDVAHATEVWSWAMSNRILIEGQLVASNRTVNDLTAREFYALAYTLMIKEAGNRGKLEEQINNWVRERKMMTDARKAAGAKAADPVWADADRLAVSLLAGN